MKGMRAHRIKIKVGNLWESPILHILLTKEDDVIVSRCLDFTVSSHGKDEKEALESLADSIKEYVLTAVENNSIDTISDPVHSKYWRMYHELESKQSSNKLKRTLKQSFQSVTNENIQKSTAEISYALATRIEEGSKDT
jgi:predicted RNase H-like HicB family nuclease